MAPSGASLFWKGFDNMAKTYAEKYLEALEEINRLKEEISQLKKERGVLLPGHTYAIKGAVIKIADDTEPGEEVAW